MNDAGGIHGHKVHTGDDNIQLIAAGALDRASAKAWELYG
jgi:hypothetical protein